MVMIIRVLSEITILLAVLSSETRGKECSITKRTINTATTSDKKIFVAFSVASTQVYTSPETNRYNKIPMDMVLYNDNNAYNMADLTFTAPYPGVYGFHYGGVSGRDTDIRMYLFAGNPPVKKSRTLAAYFTGYVQVSAYHMLKLEKDDVVYVALSNRDAVLYNDGVPSTFFSGELLHLL